MPSAVIAKYPSANAVVTSQCIISPLPAARATPAVDKAASALKPAIVMLEQCVLDELFQPQRHDLLYKDSSTAIGCSNMIKYTFHRRSPHGNPQPRLRSVSILACRNTMGSPRPATAKGSWQDASGRLLLSKSTFRRLVRCLAKCIEVLHAGMWRVCCHCSTSRRVEGRCLESEINGRTTMSYLHRHR